MVDIPGNTSTTSTISVGGSVSDSLEIVGDHDWFKIVLTAGQQIVINLTGTGVTPFDTYLYLRDSAGNLITSNDDGGSGTDSRLVFTAPSSGTYYVDVGAFDPYSGNTGTGTYELSVTTYTPPPVYTDAQIANQLVNGYWNDQGNVWHHFNVTQGGSITVNVTGLTADERTLARAALQSWSNIIGVTFTEVSSGGQIQFQNTDSGAYAQGIWSGNVTSSVTVNIASSWVTTYGTGLNSYSYQTYIHEIGHALGLGHAGNYNGNADYLSDALYANDSWAESVMSYFDQNESTYFADRGFTTNFVVTPMIADILAMQTLYGLSTTTRTGNTTYGNGSNAGDPIFNATAYPNVALTIFDSGGNDTLNYSGFSTNQTINLNPGQFSNVGQNGSGLVNVGNLAIAYGTVIENANGGSGNDTLIGNSVANRLVGNAGNDTLNGGAGADIMRGGLGNDTYYVDNAADKVIELSGQGTDSVFSSITFKLTGNVENLTLTGTAFRATGNTLANVLVGTSGNNVLNGGFGNDTMSGGAGNDVYFVFETGDSIIENAGQGRDRIDTTVTFTMPNNVEDMYLRGSSAINGTGNALDNLVSGNSANNILDGRGGADDLRGGNGADTFVFRDGEFGGTTSSTADRIIDFNHDQNDHIDLSAVDSNTLLAGDQPFAFIGTTDFHGIAGELRYQQLGANTYVYGDTDGDGLADFMIRVDGLHSLALGDFII